MCGKNASVGLKSTKCQIWRNNVEILSPVTLKSFHRQALCRAKAPCLRFTLNWWILPSLTFFMNCVTIVGNLPYIAQSFGNSKSTVNWKTYSYMQLYSESVSNTRKQMLEIKNQENWDQDVRLDRQRKHLKHRCQITWGRRLRLKKHNTRMFWKTNIDSQRMLITVWKVEWRTRPVQLTFVKKATWCLNEGYF